MIDDTAGLWLGRVWRPELQGPALVTPRDGRLIDVTSAEVPTSSALSILLVMRSSPIPTASKCRFVRR